MKRTIVFLISCLLVNYNSFSTTSDYRENLSAPDSIRLLSSPDLFNLSLKWASEYSKIFPETKMRVINLADVSMSDKKLDNGEIGVVSPGYYSELYRESLWSEVVGRDVIVPVFSAKNPFLVEITQKGISPEKLAKVLAGKDPMNWGVLLNNGLNIPAHYYYINDESISKCISAFLGSDNPNNSGIKTENSEELLASVKNDPNAIGFCRMVNILNPGNMTLAENIKLLPIDRNGNGTLDYNEKIYDDLNSFSRGVWIGKYPKALVSNIYSVSTGTPQGKSEIAFLKWILTEGQKYLQPGGYTDLLLTERQTAVDSLNEALTSQEETATTRSLSKVILILGTLIIAVFSGDFALRRIRRKKSEIITGGSTVLDILNEDSLILPKGIYFDKTHTWTFMEQNGIVKVGIDDFLQHLTGPITRIKMKNEGVKVKKGEHVLSLIQNGKQLNIYAPISGTIIEKNSALNTKASLMNSSPYNEGWVYRIEPTNWTREIQLLFMADKQKQFIKNEFSRLKDFLSGILKADDAKYGQVILQDGGELIDNALANFGPEVWEDFQSKFIDPSRQVWFYEIF
jgi:glycine cleavage system H lipoate-binding protein/ABC-type phosphate transport system substrate-binding protein